MPKYEYICDECGLIVSADNKNNQYECKNCNNYTNIKMNTRHVVWNNKKVCINCICIGNRIFATRFYYKKILHQIVEDSNLYYYYNINFLTDFNNFVRLLQSKLSKLSLHNTNLDNVYLTIIESYKYF